MFFFFFRLHVHRINSASASAHLSALATDTAGQLDVLRHDGDALGVDGAEVGVLEEADQVRLAGLLERKHGQGLEAQVCGDTRTAARQLIPGGAWRS